MVEREKVIKGITHHKLGQCDMSGKLCPYWEENDDCWKKMLGDFLYLLKEQEQAMKEKDGTISNLISQIKEISQCYERVVRCKDCKHGEECVKPYKDYWCHLHDFYQYGNWFCADGEMRDDDD